MSDFESRTPKGRAKRGRGASVGTPVNDKLLEGRKLRKGRRGSSVGNNTFQAPPSPAKSESGTPSGGVKRKGRSQENDSSEKANKRSRSCSRGTPNNETSSASNTVMLVCPETNCNKKYKDSNALKYHQSHAHNSSSLVNVDGDEESRDTCMDNNEDSTLDDLDSNMGDAASDVNASAGGDGKVDIENMEEDSCSNSVNIPTKKSEEESTEKEVERKDKKSESSKENNSTSANKGKTDPVVSNSSVQKKEISNANVTTTQSVQPPVAITMAAATPFHIVSTSASFTGSLQTTKPFANTASSALTATIVTATPIQSAIPITVTATTAPMLDIKPEHSKPTEKLIRPKTTINRPIMPSNMIALSTNVTVTQTNLTPVTTHMPTNTTSQLKPIQPKPAAMGEQPAVNPVLLGLNRDKKLKPKKKLKEKEPAVSLPTVTVSSSPFTTSNSTFSSSGKKQPVKLDGVKHEPQGVIKVAPLVTNKPPETTVQKSEVNPIQKHEGETKHFGANVGVIAAQVQPMKGIDLSSRPTDQQPSVLKVTPSLHIPAPDSNKNITDDVQSPAYSDISDANDGGSPSPMPRGSSPQVKLDDPVMSNNKAKDQGMAGTHVSGDVQSNYGIYGQYYGQSNYLMSNLPSSAHSPSAAGSAPKQLVAAVQGKDRNSAGADGKEGQGKEKREESREDKKDGGSGGKVEGVRPLNQPEYHQLQHQKWVQQQRMYIQTLPHHAQYQYMAAYGPYMDPAYHMHMMSTDPYYRQHFEKMMDDQQRRGHDGGGSRTDSDQGNRPTSHGSIDYSQGQRSASAGPSGSEDGRTSSVSLNRDDQRRSNDSTNSKDNKDRSLREKQSENHQILKENIDLKPQMDKSRMESNDPYKMSHQRMTEEQQRRHLMYQQQKYIEHQKREEQRKADSENKDYQAKNSGGANSERREVKSESRPELIKRESDSKHKSSGENTFNPDLKSASDDKNRSQSVDKRLMETPKSKVGLVNKASSPHTPSSSMPVSSTHSPSIGPGSPYTTPYMYHSQYMQSPPSYGHMQFDPVFRGVSPSPIMYTPSPGHYLHPSQLGYHVGVDENIDKDKHAIGPTKVPNEGDSKLSDSPYHTGPGGHKIHELQEKGRPSPRTGSPVMGKGEGSQLVPTPVSGSLDKNREFSNSPPIQRHVHSHHHTHVVEAAYPVYPAYSG